MTLPLYSIRELIAGNFDLGLSANSIIVALLDGELDDAFNNESISSLLDDDTADGDAAADDDVDDANMSPPIIDIASSSAKRCEIADESTP